MVTSSHIESVEWKACPADRLRIVNSETHPMQPAFSRCIAGVYVIFQHRVMLQE